MGLDISAHRQAVPVDPADLTAEGEPRDWADLDYQGYGRLLDHSHFPGRVDGLKEGYYRVAETFGFRAGSYSGFNTWRNELAQLTGAASAQEVWGRGAQPGPFVELINFSDCEGCIGPLTSAKLAADFAAFQDKVGHGWFGEQYARWRKAFEMAADGGFVEFH